MLLFIDESGDLGFDFDKRGTSTHFAITALVLESHGSRKILEKGVERTLKNKINIGKRAKDPTKELKGHKTSIEVKQYLWRQIQACDFSLYVICVRKCDLPAHLRGHQERTYNYLARLIVEKIPLDRADSSVHVEIDKSKNSAERQIFNAYLGKHIEARLNPRVGLTMLHVKSEDSKAIQAVDMLCWGITRKYALGDSTWYDSFRERIALEICDPFETTRGADGQRPLEKSTLAGQNPEA